MILVTGGGGVMGRVLVRALRDRGERVRALVLPGDSGADAIRSVGAEIQFGDIADAVSLAGVCDSVDTVFHLAAIIIATDDALYARINVEGTRHLIDEAERSGVRRFIHVSSASVTYAASTPYSRSKLAAEQLVRESNLAWTIARPTLAYDDRGGMEFNRFLEYLRAFPVVPFIGSGRALKRPVHTTDIIDGLVRISGNERSIGKVYNLSGGEAITMREFAILSMKCMGMAKKPILHLPVWFCVLLSRVMGLVMRDPPLRWPVIAGVIQDANLDPSDAMIDLGYAPVRVSDKLAESLPGKREWR